MFWRRKWQPTPVFLPGEFHRQRSLAGYNPWGCTELDQTKTTQHARTQNVVALMAKLCQTLLQPHGLEPARLLCPWVFPGKNTGAGCHFLLQGIFPTQGSNPPFLHWQADSSTTEPPGKPTCMPQVVLKCMHTLSIGFAVISEACKCTYHKYAKHAKESKAYVF